MENQISDQIDSGLCDREIMEKEISDLKVKLEIAVEMTEIAVEFLNGCIDPNNEKERDDMIWDLCYTCEYYTSDGCMEKNDDCTEAIYKLIEDRLKDKVILEDCIETGKDGD